LIDSLSHNDNRDEFVIFTDVDEFFEREELPSSMYIGIFLNLLT